jgi:hypothetical protein
VGGGSRKITVSVAETFRLQSVLSTGRHFMEASPISTRCLLRPDVIRTDLHEDCSPSLQ